MITKIESVHLSLLRIERKKVITNPPASKGGTLLKLKGDVPLGTTLSLIRVEQIYRMN